MKTTTNHSTLNPKSEISIGGDGAFRGVHASGVWFSASRRKHRSTNLFTYERLESVGGHSSGATPELARGPRALPIANSEFGFKGKLFFLALCFISPSLAQAHVSPDHTNGITNGLSHPLLGLDHILAMLAVGLWAAQLGGRARWLVPATFVSLLTVGGAMGMTGFALPFVQGGILVSGLTLGVLIAAAARLPLAGSVAVVGLFAIFHGHAHGAELQPGLSGLGYGLGFILTTAALHACGIGLGRLAQQQSKTPLLRFAGAAIALVGLFLWRA